MICNLPWNPDIDDFKFTRVCRPRVDEMAYLGKGKRSRGLRLNTDTADLPIVGIQTRRDINGEDRLFQGIQEQNHRLVMTLDI